MTARPLLEGFALLAEFATAWVGLLYVRRRGFALGRLARDAIALLLAGALALPTLGVVLGKLGSLATYRPDGSGGLGNFSGLSGALIGVGVGTWLGAWAGLALVERLRPALPRGSLLRAGVGLLVGGVVALLAASLAGQGAAPRVGNPAWTGAVILIERALLLAVVVMGALVGLALGSDGRLDPAGFTADQR